MNSRKEDRVKTVNRCDGKWMAPSLPVFISSVKLKVRSSAEDEQ